MRIITTHTNADFDSLASLVAAQKLYPDALMVFSGNAEKKVKEYLTLYSSEFKVYSASDLDLSEVDGLIVVDTKAKKRLGELSRILKNKNLEVTIWDHHPPSEDDIAGEEIMKDLRVGCAITKFLYKFKEDKIHISETEATLFAIALYEETGSFEFATVTPLDFQMMAYLIECGAKINIARDFLKEGFSAEQDALFRKLLNSIETFDVKNLPVRIAVAEMERFVKDIALVVHKLRDMGNLDCVFVIVKLPERVYLVGRSSLEELNAGEVMQEFGGGGHKAAASAMLKEGTLFDVKEKLLRILREKTRPFMIASDIMSHPVLTIKADVTVEEARKIMLRFNHSALPVADGNTIRGIISVSELDKAIHHKLHEARVSGYMRTNIKTAGPETAVSDIQKMMIDEGDGRIVIIDRNSVIKGIVTRTDVLRCQSKDIFKDRVIQVEQKLENAEPHFRNVKHLMKSRLPAKLHSLLLEIGRLADKEKYKVYVVGGFVRDLLLNIENMDLDIVVEGAGITFASILAKRFKAELKKHKKYGTAVLRLPGGVKIDIATARVESYEYPASAPTVEFSKLKYDLFRRDFTINAMAIELNQTDFGMLVDFFNGQKDLQAKLIRVLHNMSFVEDPTRIFRAVRFEQRYGFKIEKSSMNFLDNALDIEMFDRLATHKLKDEIVLILNEDLPIKAIDRMRELDVLKYIHPDIRITSAKKQIFKEITNSFTVEVLFLDDPVDRWLVNFLALVDDLSINQIVHICEKFKLSTKVITQMVQIKKEEKEILRLLEKVKMKNSEVYDLLAPLSCEGLLFYMSKSKSLRARQRIHLFLSSLYKVKLDVTGEDLKAYGIKPGPVFKKILKELLALKLDSSIKTRAEELELLKTLKS
ncbi:MAG: CBS domain-containing protein [Candidatus Firestonebacteria bacterium]|nr:CBS domain-containing protein [Candidatus Firestonebacteria bacterium]